jgi:aldehyde:ferredoxin oxidoreductase
LKALQLTGFSLIQKELNRIGEEIHRQKYRFKMGHGFSLDDVHLPKRILETSTPFGLLEDSYIKSAVMHFKQLLNDGEYEESD